MAVLPNLTVPQLEYLLAVTSAPTWADAAAQVGVTQSALSQGLAEFERRVGVALFERQGRRRVLSSSATPVLAHAHRRFDGARHPRRPPRLHGPQCRPPHRDGRRRRPTVRDATLVGIPVSVECVLA